MSSMIQSLNQTLEYSLSFRGLKWRWEAFRTGKSFAEIVLLHSLRYRVEQVFLIHRPSGLLLQKVAADSGGVQQDADMVSGMLTAIQDFVKDSFQVREEEMLNTMQVGELSVWVEPGPMATIAGVIRGTAPAELRMVFQEAIEKIHQEKKEELESFQGDADTFAGIRHHLESCLQFQYEKRKEKISPVLWAVLATVVIVLSVWSYANLREGQHWTSYVNRLTSQPGIVVTRAFKEGNHFVISGLRDPLAVDPNMLLEQSGLARGKVRTHWEAYQALLPPFILARARRALQPPVTANLKMENGTLIVSGSAPHGWIQESAKLVRVMGGIERYDTRQLKDSDLETMANLKDRIEHIIIRFIRGKAEFAEGQEEVLRNFTNQLSSLYLASAHAGREIRLNITGHADSEGTEELNFQLSRMRAEHIVQMVTERGLNAASINTRGVGSSKPIRSESSEQDKEWNRSVSFEVEILDPNSREVR